MEWQLSFIKSFLTLQPSELHDQLMKIASTIKAMPTMRINSITAISVREMLCFVLFGACRSYGHCCHKQTVDLLRQGH